MSKLSKSPGRHHFQKEKYIERCKEKGEEVSPENLDFFDNIIKEAAEQENDEEWKKLNLEYDLRSTEWILNKVRSSDDYAGKLYSALCNNDFTKRETWPLLKDERWSCSWRYAGGIIADMQEKGDYIDWYCSGGEGQVYPEIEEDLYKLGWIVVTETE